MSIICEKISALYKELDRATDQQKEDMFFNHRKYGFSSTTILAAKNLPQSIVDYVLKNGSANMQHSLARNMTVSKEVLESLKMASVYQGVQRTAQRILGYSLVGTPSLKKEKALKVLI